MLKQKVLGEKAMQAIKGGLCCWVGGGCDCTKSGGDDFVSPFEGWLTTMDGTSGTSGST